MTILDISAKRLAVLEDVFGHQIQTLMSNPFNIEASVRDADVVIGAVLIPGAKAPKLVTDDMVKQMRPGSVIVDVALTKVGLSKQQTVSQRIRSQFTKNMACSIMPLPISQGLSLVPLLSPLPM